jgi:hypothetical protein
MAWTPCVRLYGMGSPRDTSAELVPVDGVGVVVTESAEDISLPARNPVLALQHMEAALVGADLEHPDVLTPEEFRRLRAVCRSDRAVQSDPFAGAPGRIRGRDRSRAGVGSQVGRACASDDQAVDGAGVVGGRQAAERLARKT